MEKIEYSKGVDVRILSPQGDIMLDLSRRWMNRTHFDLWLKGYLKDQGICHVFVEQDLCKDDFIVCH